MPIFNSRDLKRINKYSPLIKIESGYTHVHTIAVPKGGYKCPEVNKKDKDMAERLRVMAYKASGITKGISDILFDHHLDQDACYRISNECGRIRNLSNELSKTAAEIGEK